MFKNVLYLPDGTELTSGAGKVNAIKSVTITECVNSGEELTIGSVCSNMLEVTAITPNGGLDLTAGDEVELWKVDTDSDGATMRYVGVFVLEKPTRPTANTMKLIGYDRVTKLDKDLTAWLASLTGWPYNILTFAAMVCQECGLEFESAPCPNDDYMVQQFTAQATGRKLMGWLAEICCRFCRATTYGTIEFGWYAPSGISIAPSGEHYYFHNGLTYETYAVAPVNAVQLRLADSKNGALYPEVIGNSVNSYIVAGNPILLSKVTEDLLPVLANIREELSVVTYTPCKVSVPASLEIHAGHTVQITDKNGKTFTAYVMTKTQKGQRDTLECTGSPRRDSSTATNNHSADHIAQQKADDLKKGLTQEDLFKRLTNNGAVQGLLLKDGQLYINAQYILAKSFTSTAEAYLPPTYDDLMHMLWSVTFPDQFPPEDFYDFNGDGNYTIADWRLIYDVYLGKKSLADCHGAVKSTVTVTIDPSNTEKMVSLNGINMWGTEVDIYIGANGSNIPVIKGNCTIGGDLMVDGAARIQTLATGPSETPRVVSWKSNGDGTYTLIGTDPT